MEDAVPNSIEYSNGLDIGPIKDSPRENFPPIVATVRMLPQAATQVDGQYYPTDSQYSASQLYSIIVG